MHRSAHQGNAAMIQLQKVVHQKIHNLHVINLNHVTLRSIQLAGNNHRSCRHDLIDKLRVFQIRGQIIHASSRLNDSIHLLLLQFPYQELLLFHLRQ